jgi:hypothetical protein
MRNQITGFAGNIFARECLKFAQDSVDIVLCIDTKLRLHEQLHPIRVRFSVDIDILVVGLLGREGRFAEALELRHKGAKAAGEFDEAATPFMGRCAFELIA